MTNQKLIRLIAENAVVAAIYFVLTVISTPIAYKLINFRIAELLILLCFWRRDFVVGVTVGCFLANINSDLGPADMLFGTLATLLSALLVSFSPKLLVSLLFPTLVNAFVVGAELYFLAEIAFWQATLAVGIGEGTVMLASYALSMVLWRRKSFMKALDPQRKALPSF